MAVFFGWPSEPPIGVTTAIGTLSLIDLQLGDQSHRPRVRRVGLVLLAFAFGFGWAQTYTHWQDYSTGQIYIAASETWQPGATQSEPRVLDAVVDWSEPTPRGSRVDIVYTDYLGRPLGLRLYGSQGLAEALLPGCQAQLQVALEPLALSTAMTRAPRLGLAASAGAALCARCKASIARAKSDWRIIWRGFVCRWRRIIAAR